MAGIGAWCEADLCGTIIGVILLKKVRAFNCIMRTAWAKRRRHGEKGKHLNKRLHSTKINEVGYGRSSYYIVIIFFI
jgi:hypothetical protein